MLSLILTIEVNPNRVDEFISYITEEAQDARTKEPGCRRFDVCQSSEKPNIFNLVEVYDDAAALEAHRNTPHFLLFKERAAGDLIVSKTSVLGTIIDS